MATKLINWVFVGLMLGLWLGGCDTAPAPLYARVQFTPPDLTGYTRAEGPRILLFPEVQGPHPDYLTEWWYYTGNLETESGRHFGFQLTFFRRALVPAGELLVGEPQSSDWRSDQAYSAHFTISDVEAGQYYFAEQFSRAAAGLAGAQADPYHVWLYGWLVEAESANSVRLRAAYENVALNLLLEDVKGPVFHGDGGYSRKGPEAGNASYYISQTRLTTEGAIQIDGETFPVTGLSWMDHEFSTSALSSGQIGWDWFSIQLSDDTELMLYRFRRSDGSVDRFSSGTIVEADGTTRTLGWDEFTIHDTAEWTSPHSGGKYPAAWTIDIQTLGLNLTLQPYLADQELRVSFIYWEGAVRVSGQRLGEFVTGSGYVELTGYAEPFSEDF